MTLVEDTDGSDTYSIYKSSDNGWVFTHWRDLPDELEIIKDWIAFDGPPSTAPPLAASNGTSRFGPATKKLGPRIWFP
jgi:hypothetical protein